MATEITQSECSMEKLEEMQWSDRRMPVNLKGNMYTTVVRPTMLNGAETRATRTGQEARLEVNEMKMQRWMCGVTRRNKIRIEHTLIGQ